MCIRDSQYGAGAGIGGDGFGDSAVHQEGGDFGQITVAGGKIFAYGGQAANYNYGAGAGKMCIRDRNYSQGHFGRCYGRRGDFYRADG